MDLFKQLTLPLFDLWSTPEPSVPVSSPYQSDPTSSQTQTPEAHNNQRNNMRKVIGTAQQIIEFELRRGKRRTIGFMIDDRGVTVSAPRWVSLGEIDAAVIEKSHWISRKLNEWRAHQERRLINQIQWIDGGSINFMGRPLTLKICPEQVGLKLADQQLMIGLPTHAEPERIKNTVQAWLQNEARHLFGQRLERLAMLTGKAPRRWALSSARTRWGSCTSDGTIRLNWRLMHFPLDVIDYVIAHELAHLVEMNHGPKFWEKVAQIIPNFQEARSQLTGITDDMS